MLYVYIFSDCVECRIEIQLYQEIPPEKRQKIIFRSSVSFIMKLEKHKNTQK